MNKPDLSQFNQKPCVIAGDDCLLITPKEMGVDWTVDNLCYRSVIVRVSDGLRISCGWNKFFNFSEKPSLYPNPENFNDWKIEEKLDGSLIIISKYKDQIIVRTRGVVDAFQHDSGPELQKILNANNKIIDNKWIQSGVYSLLFEHCSIINPIIVKYQEPKLVLLGVIPHFNQKPMISANVDFIANEIDVERPKKYTFNNIKEIIDNCKELKGMEGYVLQYNSSQNRVKLKGAHYLFLHRAKSSISSFDKVVDLFFEMGKPESYEKFADAVEKGLDHELRMMADENIKDVSRCYAEACRTLQEISDFVLTLDGLPRKDAAMQILARYQEEGLSSFAFNYLNKKPIQDKDVIKLILLLHDKNTKQTNEK